MSLIVPQVRTTLYALLSTALLLTFNRTEAQSLLADSSVIGHIKVLKESYYTSKDSLEQYLKDQLYKTTYYWFDEHGYCFKSQETTYENGIPQCSKTIFKIDEYLDSVIETCHGNLMRNYRISGDPIILSEPFYQKQQGHRTVTVYKNDKHKTICKEVERSYRGRTDIVVKVYHYTRHHIRKLADQYTLDTCGNETSRYFESLNCWQLHQYEYHPDYPLLWMKKTSAFGDEVYDICEREILEEFSP